MDIKSFTAVRRTGVLVLGVALLALVGPHAVADELTVRDGRGDMWIIEEGSDEPSPAPEHEIGDLRRTTYKHTEDRVVIRSRFWELDPAGKRFVLWVEMRDQDGKKSYLGVEARRRFREGRAIMFTNRGKDIDCKIRHRIDYDTNVVRAGFPRSCVGKPEFLRFKTYDEHTARDWSYAYIDDAHDSGTAFSPAWSARVPSG